MTTTLVGEAAQACIARSLGPVSRAIGCSLGPDGRTVLYGGDGQVAAAISGVEIARHAAETGGPRAIAPRLLTETLVSAERDIGDGTARLALLACETFATARRVAVDPLRRLALAERLDRLRGRVETMLEEERRAEVGEEEIAAAAGAGPELSATLAAAFRRIGPDGGIDVLADAGRGVELDVRDGFIMDAVAAGGAGGYHAGYSLADVHVIAANEALSDFGKLVAVIDGFAARRKSLLIVARRFEGSALAAIERNRREGALSIAAITPADAGPRAAAAIGDLAAACGASLVDEYSGTTLDSLKPDMLGTARAMRFDGRRVFLEGPGGQSAAIGMRLSEIAQEIGRAKHLSFDRDHAERRRARLAGRWAELRIGGVSRHDRMRAETVARRAIACMRSASRHGVVEGAGVALRDVANRLAAAAEPGDRGDAMRVASASLRSIEAQLLANSGVSPNGPPNRPGMPAPASNRASVMDPLQVTQQLVGQAFSLATSLMRVDAIVCS